jgi:hypothetical protein
LWAVSRDIARCFAFLLPWTLWATVTSFVKNMKFSTREMTLAKLTCRSLSSYSSFVFCLQTQSWISTIDIIRRKAIFNKLMWQAKYFWNNDNRLHILAFIKFILVWVSCAVLGAKLGRTFCFCTLIAFNICL